MKALAQSLKTHYISSNWGNMFNLTANRTNRSFYLIFAEAGFRKFLVFLLLSTLVFLSGSTRIQTIFTELLPFDPLYGEMIRKSVLFVLVPLLSILPFSDMRNRCLSFFRLETEEIGNIALLVFHILLFFIPLQCVSAYMLKGGFSQTFSVNTTLLLNAVVTAFAYSVFFRGFIPWILRMELGRIHSLMVSILVFASFFSHLSPGLFISLLLANTFLLFLTVALGSIWPAFVIELFSICTLQILF